jgi:hypothetical protein
MNDNDPANHKPIRANFSARSFMGRNNAKACGRGT